MGELCATIKLRNHFWLLKCCHIGAGQLWVWELNKHDLDVWHSKLLYVRKMWLNRTKYERNALVLKYELQDHAQWFAGRSLWNCVLQYSGNSANAMIVSHTTHREKCNTITIPCMIQHESVMTCYNGIFFVVVYMIAPLRIPWLHDSIVRTCHHATLPLFQYTVLL